ncbi:YbaK family protein [Bacillus suaedae]|uniref:YbaK family protein n=1 Tax=Halalkalibacter suaedae TaxID=2822140 RepID=A0A940WW75_9BACI|nr:YbaK family protein [Bacillus suaedae]MBP3953446.1 YbaK family protein [Bacillus suaedae]
MTVVTTLANKRREKQWKFERNVLKHLSLKNLKADVEVQFKPIVPFHFLSHPFLLDPCMDMAIDAYLLGAEFAKFGYYGESEQQVKARCDEELTEITHVIFNLLQGWLLDSEYVLDSLKLATENFVERWWSEGFREGEKRHRMRLH